MLNQIKTYKQRYLGSQLSDIRNLALIAFGIIVILVSWSGVKAIQRNYELQKQIAKLEQETAVQRLENDNQTLRNQYLETNQYLELAARGQFGLAAPGENVVIVPKAVALAKVADVKIDTGLSAEQVTDTKPAYQRNIEAWLDFFLGRADQPQR
ncbi:MAG: septum formation initiator family protein [Candidatus Saccharibacteria bacterium]|nr:septum formation initiator family protein [Candidatus Saccharibacteria bacterium]